MNNLNTALLLALAALLLGGCTSTSVLGDCENTLVRYQQISKDTGQITLEMVLVEQNHRNYADLYSDPRQTANVKKVPHDDFLYLIQILNDNDFFELANGPAFSPNGTKVEASRAIVVEQGSERWTLKNNMKMTAEQRKDLTFMITRFLDCYDSIMQLQTVTNEKGMDFFVEEQKKLQQDKQAKENQ
jgi:hypothetical protein